MQLYNKYSAEHNAKKIEESGKKRTTISFYKYHKIGNPELFRNYLFLEWDKLDVLGRTYIAHEGINAQISVPDDSVKTFINHLYSIPFLEGIRINYSIERDDKSFLKLKIKVKEKIVSDGLDDSTFDPSNSGVHLKAQEFNNILEDPNTVLVDMRNHYESEIGHFKGAITPDVDNFRESLDIIEDDLKENKQDKNLVMYCTGGIRCEKASAYFKHKGFKSVFQLEGGIIEYARQVENQNLENKYLGKNFVFDERRAEKISDDVIAQCHFCGDSCDTHSNCVNSACHLLFIQCPSCAEKLSGCCSAECKEVVSFSPDKQKELRKGKGNENKKFTKGRSDLLKYKQKVSSIKK